VCPKVVEDGGAIQGLMGLDSVSGEGCPSFSTSAVALFKHGVFEVPSDNLKPLFLGQIKPRFERSYG